MIPQKRKPRSNAAMNDEIHRNGYLLGYLQAIEDAEALPDDMAMACHVDEIIEWAEASRDYGLGTPPPRIAGKCPPPMGGK